MKRYNQKHIWFIIQYDCINANDYWSQKFAMKTRRHRPVGNKYRVDM